MTERELIQQQQELGDSRFLVTRSGKFFSAYGCGAFALARATGYRVMHRQRSGGVGLHPRKNGGRARPQGQQKFV